MLQRTLAVPLHRASLHGEPVLVQGPRGSGKTALVRREFPAHTFVSLEDSRDRTRARANPAAFWARLRGPAIVDGLHRAPELMEHLPGERPLVLVSSRRLRLPYETFELYAPTLAEREGRPPLSLEMLGHFAPPAAGRTLEPAPAERSWIYKDVREMIQVRDLDRFERFYECALSSSGTVLDQQGLADESEVSHATAGRWLRALEDCFQVLRLPPSELDFGRRLVRSPKLHVLGSERVESRAVWEIYQNARHQGVEPGLRYWRDSNGFEIQMIVESEGAAPVPVSISAEPTPADLVRLHRWMQLAGVRRGALISERMRLGLRGGVVGYSLGQL
ncbi:MAG: ATP-binding protein [Acidobacteria bacterium]|nr:ATP-binding protein [Acidobacteriota bacterium]